MTICSISTSWRSSRADSADQLVEAMKGTGMTTLELEFRLSEEMMGDIKRRKKEWGIEISSLHAVCPRQRSGMLGAERFLLNDLDENNRKEGVKDVIRTMENGVELGAKAVVVHCGRVDMKEPVHNMMKHYDEGALETYTVRDELHAVLLERMAKSKKGFSQLLKSLDEINLAGVKHGMKVGLENRYYFREMPNLDEFGVIFNNFDGGSLHYWHDTGHAHVQEVLFGLSQKMMLETFSDRIAGIHLHDVQDGYTDHNQPGSGVVDFEMIKTFLKPDTIKVMELNNRVSPEQARKGIAFLKDKGLFV